MATPWYIIAIIAAELTWSYLAAMTTISTVTRRRWKAVLYEVGSALLSILVLRVIAQHDWNLYMIAASVLGVAGGTFLAASRKVKRKRKTMKRMQGVTTA